MGTYRFEFIGAGEPFLHPNALEFMGRAKHAGSTCMVNTSGYVFDKEKMDALLKMGFDMITQINSTSGSLRPRAFFLSAR